MVSVNKFDVSSAVIYKELTNIELKSSHFHESLTFDIAKEIISN